MYSSIPAFRHTENFLMVFYHKSLKDDNEIQKRTGYAKICAAEFDFYNGVCYNIPIDLFNK